MRKLLVAACAALGAELAGKAGLERFGQLVEVEPVFPALTIPAQATLLTGLAPGGHGAAANGFYQRELRRTFFWEQSAALVFGQRLWERVEERHGVQCSAALLFFQNSMGANAEVILTPAPLHAPDGRIVTACYGRPPYLAAELDKLLGSFPLHHYWGPGAGLASSQWIAAAAGQVLERGKLDLIMTYLPHLDYDLQRFGPDSPEAGKAAGELALIIEELSDAAERHGYDLVIAGDYAIEPASGFAQPNLALREAGLLKIRRVGPWELPDFATSGAFAVVDHQVAHVYCQNGACAGEAADALEGLAGVGRIIDAGAQKELGIASARGGDLVLEAAPGDWFAYEWWTGEESAPPYARTVDIHNKPGYDPLELFFGEDKRGTASDGRLVRGTHGRAAGAAAALILPDKAEAPDRLLSATEVSGLLCDLIAG